MASYRRAGVAAAAAALPLAAAYRFAVVYRERAGIPRRRSPVATPADLGLAAEEVVLDSDGATLSAWWIPAEHPMETPSAAVAARPAVVLVHGWSSARDRTLPMAGFLHAAGFGVLTLDVRGHGANDPETMPVTAGEFAADAAAGVAWLVDREDVGRIGLLGHSMGAIGAIVAAADDAHVAAVVSVSAPVDPVRLTRRTFQLAHLPIPDPVAYPLAWLTSHVYLRPRGHEPHRVSASRAVARYRGPLLLVHGDADAVVPIGHHRRLTDRARRARTAPTATRDGTSSPPVRTLVVRDGAHSWLYEDPGFRGTVAAFFAEALAGPLPPEDAAARAVAYDARRMDEPPRPPSESPRAPGAWRLAAELLGAPVRRPVPVERRPRG